MQFSRILWGRLRKLGRIKLLYKLFYLFFKLSLKDGKITTIYFGPLKGRKWKHYNCFQPWMSIGLYEPETTEFLFKRLHGSGGCFFDIGANAGYYSLLSAKIMNENGRVISFEPIPFNVKVITEQLEINGLGTKCKVEQCAVSDSTDKAELTIPEKNANAYLSEINVSHFKSDVTKEKISIDCITLDEYVQTYGKPSFIKMDIEGAEVKALRGAKKLLELSDAPEFIVTAHSAKLYEDCMAIFKQNNFETMQIGGNIFAKKNSGLSEH